MGKTIIFKASMDALAKGITIGTSILFAGIISGQLVPSYSEAPEATIVLSTFLILVYGLCFMFRPLHYSVNPEEIIVYRPINKLIIKKGDIKSIRQVSKEDMKMTIRTFGVGGLFGYFGKFSNAKLGSLTFYATRRNNIVLIETISNKKMILTPDEPEAFVKEVMP